MNMYTLLKAANKTTDNDKIFGAVPVLFEDFAYIEDMSTWKIVGHDEPLEIMTVPLETTMTVDDTLPPNSIKAETLITDNLIIANKEFDDIVRSIVKDALESKEE